MKKFAMAVVTASLLSAASAESCASSLSGFYAGVQAGVNSTTGTVSMHELDPGVQDRTISFNPGAKSFVGGLFAGYGMGVGSCTYVGAEFNANLGNSNAKVIAIQNGDKVTIGNKASFGAKVRLGYIVSPQAMLFLGLGLEYAKWSLKYVNGTGTVALKLNKGKIVFAPSVGMDAFINKNMFVRAEYTYSLGAKFKKENKVGTQTTTIKANMSQQRFALGFGYKF
jgi:opacity protein-like surface antigen